MTDQFDQDLRGALQQGDELRGWEFSSEMRRKVMDRVRTEQAVGIAPQPAVRRPLSVPRPLIWVTVAAAALVVAVRVGGPLGGFGGSAKQDAAAPAKPSAASTAASPPAAAPITGSAGTAISAESAPGQAPTESAKVGAQDAARPGPRLVVLPLPPASPSTAQAEESKAEAPLAKALMATPAARNVALQSTGSQVAELQSTGLRIVDAAGAEVLKRPLDGITDRSLVAVSSDGRVAVSAGAKVFLLNGSGQVDRTLEIAAEASGLAWSPDGRIAVADGANATVFEAAKPQFRTAVTPGARIAFSADGGLAVLSQDGAKRRLTVLDRQGQRAMEATVEPGGEGLAFSPDGSVVIAAGSAFDRSGNRLWAWPIPLGGVAVVPGQPLMVTWDTRNVAGITPASGNAIWQAEWNGAAGGFRKAVTSPDGQFIAVLADADGSGVVWVLTPDGSVVYSERLASPPLDIALFGRTLAILDPAKLVLRVVR